MEKLNSSGMRTQLDEIVLENKASILGICVGMQMLARNSNEGKLKGLGWIPGEVRHFSEKLSNAPLSLPHMGWNTIDQTNTNKLFSKGLDKNAQFYFCTHIFLKQKTNLRFLQLQNTVLNFTAQYLITIYMVYNSILKRAMTGENNS